MGFETMQAQPNRLAIDRVIENIVKNCKDCQMNKNKNPWEWINKPWVRLHLDYAGP